VATRLRYSGISNTHFISNLRLIMPLKELIETISYVNSWHDVNSPDMASHTGSVLHWYLMIDPLFVDPLRAKA